MSQSKKKAGADVAHPGTTAPSDTSKSIITPRPMIKDPMVVEDDEKDGSSKKPLAKKSKTKIAPPEETTEAVPEKPDSEPDSEPEKEPEPETPVEDKTDDQDKKKSAKSDPDAEKAEHVAQDAKIQKLVENKKYFLPINAVEHRKSRRFVALGVVLALVLALAWVDIALDAGLIDLGGIKPVTRFFSN